MSIYIGLDIGGTKLLVASADSNGNILNRTQRTTPLALNAGLTALKDMIREVAGNETIVAFGAAIGGPLDWEHGIVSPLHQPEWRNIPLKDIIEQEFGSPLLLDVDTNVAAIGEYAYGGHKSTRLLYLTLSTGMGGGFLIDGKIYRGMNGAHPEVGHQAIPYKCQYPDRIICECGATGCLEALVSGNGIRRIYSKLAEELTESEWREVGYNLGQGLRNLTTIYLPDLIILGGGVALGGGDKLLNIARSVMTQELKLVPAPQLALSNLGYDTALRGAIALAMQTINRS
jgi:glucokinase